MECIRYYHMSILIINLIKYYAYLVIIISNFPNTNKWLSDTDV